MKKNTQLLIAVFWVITLADVTGIATGTTLIHTIAKPLLIPLLCMLLFTAAPAHTHKWLLFTALFFSWLGDLFLLFENHNAYFFIYGLASFLLTHLLYIFYFLNTGNKNKSLLKKHPLLAIAATLYTVGLTGLLFPYLTTLTIPVCIYATVIACMLLCSLHIYYKVPREAALLYITGAVFFVLSDSLLAVNKFYHPFKIAGVLIMLTYGTAQYFIITGYIKQHRHD